MTVAFLPRQRTRLISSQPERLTTLNRGFTNTCHVARKSLHVTCRPSLHLAPALYLKAMVSGLCLVIFGLLSQSLGTSAAGAFQYSQPSKMRFVTRAVA